MITAHMGGKKKMTHIKPIKKIKILAATAALSVSFLFSGCSGIMEYFAKAPEMQPNAQSFKMYDSDQMNSMLIDVNGRTYAPYGVVKMSMSKSSLKECIGYVNDNKDSRLYTLNEDPFDNYLIQKSVRGFMDPDTIWRDISTIEDEVLTPEYIDPLNYEEWAKSGCYSEMKEFNVDILLDADDVYELSMDYKVNGEDCGTSGVRNANKTELKKGDIYDMSIAEISIYGKFDKDGPLDVECHFHVETMSGEMHDLEYVFKDTVELGDKISLTLTGNAKDGYILK